MIVAAAALLIMVLCYAYWQLHLEDKLPAFLSICTGIVVLAVFLVLDCLRYFLLKAVRRQAKFYGPL